MSGPPVPDAASEGDPTQSAAAATPLALSLDATAVPAQPVGAGRYTIDLVAALGARPDVALTLWTRRGDVMRWSRAGPLATVRPSAPRPRPARLAWEQLALPRLLRSTSVAVHHAPHYTMPERAGVPSVVTIHDLTFVEHPEWHERSKVIVFRRAIRVAARRAAALVCVSASTSDRLHERFRPAGQVFVVPHGVDHERFRTDVDAQHDASVRGELGVREPYVVFVGTIEPRKAVPVLLDAFDRVAGRRPDLSLVLVGRPGWGTQAVERSLAGLRSKHKVMRLGYLPDGAVPAVLRGASVAAYPALEEGFGLPALEAMACGTPLVTTAGTAMAELAQNAALLVPPGDAAELAGAIEGALDGGRALEERRAMGLRVAASHTWEASAARHVDAYRWAASRHESQRGSGHESHHRAGRARPLQSGDDPGPRTGGV